MIGILFGLSSADYAATWSLVSDTKATCPMTLLPRFRDAPTFPVLIMKGYRMQSRVPT